MTNRYPGGLVRRTAANTSITGASGVWDLGSQAQAVKTNTWPISGLANPISGSLRFRSSASAYLNRTFGTPTLSTKWTWSGWIKFGDASTYYTIFDGGSPDTRFGRYPDTNQLYVNNDSTNFLITTPVYRDYSAWYHAVLAFDSSQGTASNRLRLYINGSEVTAFATDNRSSISGAIGINTATAHGIGRQPSGGSAYFDGYLAEVNFIDGQQLTPSSFGQTSPITGVWEPIKYTGTYGTNGFYLSLSDTSSIGKDFSGNGNNWTPNNISTTNDSTFDLMRDVPTQWAPQGVTDVGGTVRGNYCVWNSLKKTSGVTVSNANLTLTVGASINEGIQGTIGVSSGKWYAEVTGGPDSPGVVLVTDAADYPGATANSYGYHANATKYNNGSSSSYGATFTSTDVIGIALDMDAGTVTFYKNNVSQGTAFTGLVGTFTFCGRPYGATSNWNFGQRPFTYTPPSGFKSLCTTNLPTPTIGATTATAANKYFDATLITGTAATQVITNAGGFQPDFVWLKSRTNANNPTIYDAIRGVNTILYPALTNAEQVGTAQLTAFNSNGFTLGASENANDSNGEASVGWQWNAGGSTVTNTAGSISSQVRANPTAGFSVVTYTSPNNASDQTVGHGLGVKPSMIIVKNRDNTYNWDIYHSSLGYNSSLIFTTATTRSGAFGAEPTSTLFTTKNTYTHNSTDKYVAYCFAAVAGYSAFGSYTGNGSTDGPFIYTGFRPRFVMIKASSISDENWYIVDSSRSPYNAAILYLSPNNSGAEASPGAAQFFDFLSNGFKLRVSGSYSNSSGATYIYMAFAENPFKNSLAR